MSHYEMRLQQDLDHIRERVASVAHSVRIAVDRAVVGLLVFDKSRLNAVILGDHPINREIRAIDGLCHAFVARHLPAAGHLRFVSSVLRVNIALERIGDYAVTIGRVSMKLEERLPESVADQLRAMSEQALWMLERATSSFLSGDAELARESTKLGDKVDRVHDRAFAELVGDGERSHEEVVSVLTVFGRLERVSDQAKNICELALFAALGETKPPKIYPILFVDRTNALHGPLAQSLAAKAFPNSGRYHSAGWEPAEALDPGLVSLAGRLGLDLSYAPQALEPLDKKGDYHVVVVINAKGEAPLGPIPFHTAILDWEVDPTPQGDAAYDALGHELGARIRDLMELLRGADAD